ncbi:MAG: class I SAM-dependent methyltransferase [Deltaproteobacteria bacterium]|nr:class I SAM-dependent methyltransferase [Deltaproteobacteria bacterium]
MSAHPSMAGYAEEAETLIRNYERHSFEEIFADILHLFPDRPCRALDIGAGTGRHAAALARRGHAVVAVEPTKELREAGQRLHTDVPLTWIDDALPELAKLQAPPLDGPYGLILMAAVLMHFDADERPALVARCGNMLAPGGRFVLSLRNGPIPAGRRMFPVPREEIVALADEHGMTCVGHAESADHSGRPGVSWTLVCFEKN